MKLFSVIHACDISTRGKFFRPIITRNGMHIQSFRSREYKMPSKRIHRYEYFNHCGSIKVIVMGKIRQISLPTCCVYHAQVAIRYRGKLLPFYDYSLSDIFMAGHRQVFNPII